MKKHLILWVAALGVLLLIAAFLFWRSDSELAQKNITPTSSPSNNGTPVLTSAVPAPTGTPPATYPTAEDVAEEMKWINTPINFWGKVVDEDGNPIPDVTVSYTAMDKPLEQLIRDQGTRHTGKSEANGLFSITGIKGMGLGIQVTKDGYYQTKQSAYSIGYAVPSEHKPPSPNDPTIFVLRKMGETEPLKVVSSGGIRVPQNGQPVSVSLAQGRAVPAGQGDIQVEVLVQDQQKDAQGRYPWRYKISVPGGGLLERKRDGSFVAPENGYNSSDEIEMAPYSEQWGQRSDKEYFIKLSNGTFGRLKFGVRTAGEYYIRIESHLNPMPGSRNLEYDPAKVVPNP